MLAWLDDLHSCPLLGSFLANHIAHLELPGLDRAFETAVPCPEAGFWAALTRCGDVNKGVSEKAGAAKYWGRGVNVK